MIKNDFWQQHGAAVVDALRLDVRVTFRSRHLYLPHLGRHQVRRQIAALRAARRLWLNSPWEARRVA